MNYMQSDSKILIDTNVLVYSIDKDSEKHQNATDAIKKQFENKMAVVSAQTIAEFIYVTTEKKKKLTMEQANQFAMDVIDNSELIYYQEKEALRANEIKHAYSVPFFDALLVATMERAKIFTIITENEKDFKLVPWITVINPFKK